MPDHARRGNFIQCGQCSEHFPMLFTLSCPRCGRLNDRSIFVLGLKVLGFILCIAAVAWTVWASKKVGGGVPSEAIKPMPKTPPASAGEPELRF